jgi:hypothetical protein
MAWERGRCKRFGRTCLADATQCSRETAASIAWRALPALPALDVNDTRMSGVDWESHTGADIGTE